MTGRIFEKQLRSSRRGVIMFVVTIVISILTLGGVTLLALMQTEYDATIVRNQELQINNTSRSAVALMESLLLLDPEKRDQYGGLYENPTLFCDVSVLPMYAGGRGNVKFTILSPQWDEDRITGVRYGLVNESSRLNLAAVLEWEKETPGVGRQTLLKLPGMTATMADSILDWIDTDEKTRPQGAESTYYSKLGLTYSPRNAVPVFLEELLLVREVTRLQVYGTDEKFNFNDVANTATENAFSSTLIDSRSLGSDPLGDFSGTGSTGTFDPLQDGGARLSSNFEGQIASGDGVENLGEMGNLGDGLNSPSTNRSALDSMPNRFGGAGPTQTSLNSSSTPWFQLLTVFSAEKDVDPDGQARIDLNGGDLAFLYDELSEYVGQELAHFIIFYRQYGPATSAQLQTFSENAQAGKTQEMTSTAENLDFSRPAQYVLKTPLDIVDAVVAVPRGSDGALSDAGANGESSAAQSARQNGAAESEAAAGQEGASTGRNESQVQFLTSPFQGNVDSQALFRYLDYVSTSPSTILVGRVNVNESPRVILEAIPDLTEADVREILNRRPDPLDAYDPQYRHAAWLYTERIVNLEKMKKLWSKVTAGGDVYRAQIVSFIEEREERDHIANQRGEVVIDQTVSPPRQVFYKDLSMYGQGFPLDVLRGMTRGGGADGGMQQPLPSNAASNDFPQNNDLDAEFLPQREDLSPSLPSEWARDGQNQENLGGRASAISTTAAVNSHVTLEGPQETSVMPRTAAASSINRTTNRETTSSTDPQVSTAGASSSKTSNDRSTRLSADSNTARDGDTTASNLLGANSTGSNATGTNATGANATGANATGANASGANASGVEATGAGKNDSSSTAASESSADNSRRQKVLDLVRARRSTNSQDDANEAKDSTNRTETP